MVASNTPGKFDDFDRMIAESKRSGVKDIVVHHPEVLGDNFDELVMNLNKLAEAELRLSIVPPSKRKKS